jgi:hypothetical protein
MKDIFLLKYLEWLESKHLPKRVNLLLVFRHTIGLDLRNYFEQINIVLYCPRHDHQIVDDELIQTIGYCFYDYDCMVCINAREPREVREPKDDQFLRPKKFYFYCHDSLWDKGLLNKEPLLEIHPDKPNERLIEIHSGWNSLKIL